MADDKTPPPTRRRLAGDERRAEILAAASDLIDAQGFLPVPMGLVARAAGISKGLVYAHFPTQAALCNAVLLRAMTALAGRMMAAEVAGFEDQAVAWTRLYFDEVAQRGTVLHILFTDPVLDGERDAAALALRDSLWRRLARAGRGCAPLPLKERLAALAIILSLPEETGRLAHRGEMEVDRARELCADLVRSALHGLRKDASSPPIPSSPGVSPGDS